MKYPILLFDLDGTILDFDANEADSLRQLFQIKKENLTEDVLQVYHGINEQLWRDYENGKIVQEEVLNTRFSKTMAIFHKNIDGREWEATYRELLGNGHQVIEGAPEVLKKLRKKHRIFAATNGVTKTQLNRLKLAGLEGLFEMVFTSQDIGIQKPQREFFQYVMSHISEFMPDQALMIGDSLISDIQGGLNAGLPVCWVNLKGFICPQEIQPTYQITALKELYPICE